MLKLPISARLLQEMYRRGENIMSYLTSHFKDKQQQEVIEVAYDMQSGCYVDAMINAPHYVEFKHQYIDALFGELSQLQSIDSILDAGVGEGITLAPLLDKYNGAIDSYAVDISWSRLSYAKEWLAKQGHNSTQLCSGNLTDLPFADNSIDLVFTSHAIEPNYGSEKEVIQELFRIARKYVVLLEPSYEMACDEGKARMERLGYCRDIKEHCLALGYRVLKHERFAHSSNPLNPTAITIIEKLTDIPQPEHILACPEHKTPLIAGAGALYSEEGLRAYPIIADIPCMRVENSVFASHFTKFNAQGTDK